MKQLLIFIIWAVGLIYGIAIAALPDSPLITVTRPALDTNGNAIPATQPISYPIYCNGQRVATIPDNTETNPQYQFAVGELPDGNYSCGVSAFDQSAGPAGGESAAAEVPFFTVQAPPQPLPRTNPVPPAPAAVQ